MEANATEATKKKPGTAPKSATASGVAKQKTNTNKESLDVLTEKENISIQEKMKDKKRVEDPRNEAEINKYLEELNKLKNKTGTSA